MAKSTCAVCDRCGKHQPLTDFSEAPKGWYAQFTGHVQNVPIYCTLDCLEMAVYGGGGV